jgi:SAM-dependent methyltransferase
MRCIACSSTNVGLREEVSTSAVSGMWRAERRLRGDLGARAETGPDDVREVLGSDRIRVLLCGQCGLEMCLPMRTWSSEEYPPDEIYPEDRWEYREFLSDLGAAPRRVLELGCGEGYFLRAGELAGHEPVGIDFSASAVRRARSRGLQAIRGGFEALQSRLGESSAGPLFDAVALFQVIEHLEDPAAVFAALDKFTMRGTLIGISCPSPHRFSTLIRETRAGNRDFWDYPPYHVLHWTARALSEFLAGQGWEVVRTAHEPFTVSGASAVIGCSRARALGVLNDPVRRRLLIAGARLRLVFSRPSWTGTSLYVLARRR